METAGSAPHLKELNENRKPHEQILIASVFVSVPDLEVLLGVQQTQEPRLRTRLVRHKR